jgi:hypothetical protein
VSDDNSGAVLCRGSDAQQKNAGICPKSRDVFQSAAASHKSGGIRSDEGMEVGREGASLKKVKYPPAWQGGSRSGVWGDDDDASVTTMAPLLRCYEDNDRSSSDPVFR